jgi:hypothetical protein
MILGVGTINKYKEKRTIMKVKTFFLSAVCIFILYACKPDNEINKLEEIGHFASFTEECISPVYTEFYYPVSKYDKNLPGPGRNLFVLPPSPWEIEVDLKEKSLVDDGVTANVIHTHVGDNIYDIWIHASYDEKQNKILIFDAKKETFRSIDEEINTILMDSNEGIWGSHDGKLYLEKETDLSNYSILSYFDYEENLFLPVSALKEIPVGVEIKGAFYFSTVILDKNDVFWIFVPNGPLFSYDINKGLLIKHYESIPLLSDAALAPDNTMYLFVRDVSYEDGHANITNFIIHFLPLTSEFEYIDLNLKLEPYPIFRNILVDHDGRLWLDNAGFLDVDNEWYQIQRASVFLSQAREDDADYRYKSASVILESSDERIWYLHNDNGMIYLDPKDGEWCWFTTYQSNIVEDTRQNLWMVADGKLYRNNLAK